VTILRGRTDVHALRTSYTYFTPRFIDVDKKIWFHCSISSSFLVTSVVRILTIMHKLFHSYIIYFAFTCILLLTSSFGDGIQECHAFSASNLSNTCQNVWMSSSTLLSRLVPPQPLTNAIMMVEAVAVRSIMYLLLVGVVARMRNLRSLRRRDGTFDRLGELFSDKRCTEMEEKWSLYSLATSPRVVTNDEEKPYRHGVVMLGGFGDAPSYWDRLMPYLKKYKQRQEEKVLFYAPRTPGWARRDFQEAMRISYKDWVLAGREAVLTASALCDKVTVVAHSTGALVAAAIAEDIEVDSLVFTGSNFLPAERDEGIRRLLLKPIIGKILPFVKPNIVKRLRNGRPVDTLNKEYHTEGFYLKDFPLNAVIEMWKLQVTLTLCYNML